MNKKLKIALITAICLMLAGGIIFAGVMTMFNWDFNKLSTVKYETNEYTINKEYKNISIVTNIADTEFLSAEDNITKIICYEQKNMKHSVAAQNDTLEIKVIDERKWYNYIGINFSTPKITVYIPKAEYGTLTVNSSTGDVQIPKDFKFKDINISLSTGDVINCANATENIKIKTTTGKIQVNSTSSKELVLSATTGKIEAYNANCSGTTNINVSTGSVSLTNLRCKKLISNGSTGAITLKNVIADNSFFIKRSTGSVNFNACDATEIFVKTSTGNVAGSLLSSKVFIANTSTGSIDVPKTTSGGRCEIITSTGNIKIYNE